jgi:proteasome lid subunit RPN8/RPN11
MPLPSDNPAAIAGNMERWIAANILRVKDTHLVDNAETVYISSLALLKMLRHGRAGVPMEVMGLMLGEFVDDYTVRVVDVFAMPQSGTGVSVEAVDPVFQTKMMDMLRQTGRSESSATISSKADTPLDPRLSLDGITHILGLDAGSHLLISIPNNPSNSSHLALSPL